MAGQAPYRRHNRERIARGRQPNLNGGPDNRHHGADQWLFVISGTGLAIVEGSRRALRKGSLLLVERGERHEIRNTGRTLLKTINFYSPTAYMQSGTLKAAGKPAGGQEV